MTAPTPAVSVVIPTYQRAHLIARCVDSVLEQTRAPDEVIVVDDGSTDDTLAVLAGYGDRIVVVAQPNGGASVARNSGVARASSPWVAFCDSDDLWTADHLERLVDAIVATEGSAGLYFDDTAIAASDGGGTFFGVAELEVEGHRLVAPPVPWLHARLQPMLLQASVVRRSIYDDLGGLDPALGTRHDTDFFYRLGFSHPMCAVEGVGVHLCDDAGDSARLTGQAGQRSRVFWQESLRMHDGLLRLAPDGSSKRELRAQCAGDHLRLAGFDARERRPSGVARHLVHGLRLSPSTIGTLAVRGLRRRLRGRARDTSRIPR